MARRVVVTGHGAISPCGPDATSLWTSIVEARSGIGPITRFDASAWSVRIAGEVRGFDPDVIIGKREAHRMDRFIQFAVVAAREAVADAGLDLPLANPERLGIYVGSGIGGLEEITQGTTDYLTGGPRSVSPFFIPRALINLAAGHLARIYSAQGPSLAPATACAAGNHAIGEAWRAIRLGDADVILAGGAEASVIPIGIASFMIVRALSRRNHDPAGASRPFDRDRDGFVMSEGSAILVLEELEHARARGARIYAEIVGYALNNDAFHPTAPPPDGAGAARCMRKALASAAIAPEAVGYINAHGTSTPPNDSAETAAIKTVFGSHARHLAISSTKSVTGHLMGAAGGIEAIATVRALHDGILPPTANLENPDPECDLDYIPLVARQKQVDVALSNAFGFGGTNAILVFRTFRG